MERSELDEIGKCYANAHTWDREEMRECDRLAIDAGLQRVSEGANRSVWRDEDSIYKFFKFDPEELADNSIHGNRREVELFRTAPPELRAHLAAPHDWADDYQWVKFHAYDERAHSTDDFDGFVKSFGWNCDDLEATEDGVIVDYEYCSSTGEEMDNRI